MHGTGQVRAERRLGFPQLANGHLGGFHAERFLEISRLGKMHPIGRISGDDVGSIPTETSHVGVLGVGMSGEGDASNEARIPQCGLEHKGDQRILLVLHLCGRG